MKKLKMVIEIAKKGNEICKNLVSFLNFCMIKKYNFDKKYKFYIKNYTLNIPNYLGMLRLRWLGIPSDIIGVSSAWISGLM